jgi:cardiolipin synthase
VKATRSKTTTTRKSPRGSRLANKWGPLTGRAWLEVIGVVAAGLCIYSIFFVKREVVSYRPSHQFSVRDPAFFGSAHAAGDPTPVEGNKITLLQNGDAAFPAMLEAIGSAKKTVNFEAFLFHSGEVGTKFIDALVKQAKAGVEVRVLLDGVGSGRALKSADVDKLKDGGCKFAYFHPTRALRLDRLNRRTHRRVLVVDGRVAFTGGIGFADEWQGNADAPDHWRDTHAKIEGPLVAKLQGAFQQHWLGETDEVLGGPGQFPHLDPAGSLRAELIGSTEFSVAALPLLQAVAIASAEKSIYIINPYCTPNDDQVYLLTEAVKRGVDVRMILPGKHNDQPWTKAAGRGSYGDLLKGGVKLFEYKPTMIHSKTMVVDGMFSVLGTSNLDARSAAINEEIDISVYDEAFGKQMDDVFARDLELSKTYRMEDFQKRTLWERFTEWAVLPFRSQL